MSGGALPGTRGAAGASRPRTPAGYLQTKIAEGRCTGPQAGEWRA